ncbi:hypothetical protein Ciccas_001825 [Cichlidogyrus casuarinus]|uniref:Uncharacterized protein n=1 Tax=Cichlidogyrus casuarinus TaxID=1844966 RepID=A0ABD2QIZ9_9PLAT
MDSGISGFVNGLLSYLDPQELGGEPRLLIESKNVTVAVGVQAFNQGTQPSSFGAIFALLRAYVEENDACVQLMLIEHDALARMANLFISANSSTSLENHQTISRPDWKCSLREWLPFLWQEVGNLAFLTMKLLLKIKFDDYRKSSKEGSTIAFPQAGILVPGTPLTQWLGLSANDDTHSYAGMAKLIESLLKIFLEPPANILTIYQVKNEEGNQMGRNFEEGASVLRPLVLQVLHFLAHEWWQTSTIILQVVLLRMRTASRLQLRVILNLLGDWLLKLDDSWKSQRVAALIDGLIGGAPSNDTSRWTCSQVRRSEATDFPSDNHTLGFLETINELKERDQRSAYECVEFLVSMSHHSQCLVDYLSQKPQTWTPVVVWLENTIASDVDFCPQVAEEVSVAKIRPQASAQVRLVNYLMT